MKLPRLGLDLLERRKPGLLAVAQRFLDIAGHHHMAIADARERLKRAIAEAREAGATDDDVQLALKRAADTSHRAYAERLERRYSGAAALAGRAGEQPLEVR